MRMTKLKQNKKAKKQKLQLRVNLQPKWPTVIRNFAGRYGEQFTCCHRLLMLKRKLKNVNQKDFATSAGAKKGWLLHTASKDDKPNSVAESDSVPGSASSPLNVAVASDNRF